MTVRKNGSLPRFLRRLVVGEKREEVLLSAAPGYEFADWGGVDHVGGGSHGSLHRSDSLGALAFCGVEPPRERVDGAWSIADIAPMIRAHFGAPG